MGRVRWALGLSLGLHLGVVYFVSSDANREPKSDGFWRGSIEIEIVDLGGQSQDEASDRVQRFVSRVTSDFSSPKVPESVKEQSLPKGDEGSVESSSTPSSLAAGDARTSGGEGGELTPLEATAAEIYVRELRRQLERKKSYPLAAKRMGHQGRVVVRFVLERSGQVKSAQIVQASSSKFLNQAAEDLIRRLDGLEPFPVQLTKSEWAFQVPIDYHM